MAAGAWTVYNLAKKKIGNSTLNLSSTVYRMTLHTSASNANTATLGTYASVTSEVTQANGYLTNGVALTTERWISASSAGTGSAGQYMFDVDDVIWTATGGTIAGIKFAVIYISGTSANARHLLCRSQLTSSQFTLSQNNTLTIQINSAGVLTLA